MKHLIALTALCLVLPVAHAELAISNSKVNFQNTPVDGFGKTTAVTVQNLNSAPAQVAVEDGCWENDNFYVTSECDVTLAPNQMCNISIRFQPYQFGTNSCSVTVKDSLGDNALIEITGLGVQPN